MRAFLKPEVVTALRDGSEPWFTWGSRLRPENAPSLRNHPIYAIFNGENVLVGVKRKEGSPDVAAYETKRIPGLCYPVLV